MKADFSAHEGTLLLYPTRRDVWREGAVPIAETVVALSRLIATYEPVILGALPELDHGAIVAGAGDGVRVCPMQYDDIWARDVGAVPCADALVKFGFNAWGGDEGLYNSWDKDSTVPEQMAALLNKPLRHAPLTLEGGNLLTNGAGTLIAIRQTVCNDNRNKGLDAPAAEAALRRALGVERVIWIEQGLAFDETGGHIDNLCAFADPTTILLAWTDEKESPQYDIVRAAYDTLAQARGAQGERFEIVKVPLPRAFRRTVEDCEGLLLVPGSKERALGEWIQPSYINFIFANGAVILPEFGEDTDSTVRALLTRVFPDRAIRTIPAREIVLGGGGLHCITKNY